MQSRTKDGPTRTKSDCLDTTIPVPERTSHKASNESTEIVDRNLSLLAGTSPTLLNETYNAPLEQGIGDYGGSSLWVWVSKLHRLVIVILGIVYAAHHSLIVTEEENGQGSYAVDGNKKLALLKAVHDIVLGNLIHVCCYDKEKGMTIMTSRERWGCGGIK